jgi:hypothetical protein
MYHRLIPARLWPQRPTLIIPNVAHKYLQKVMYFYKINTSIMDLSTRLPPGQNCVGFLAPRDRG